MGLKVTGASPAPAVKPAQPQSYAEHLGAPTLAKPTAVVSVEKKTAGVEWSAPPTEAENPAGAFPTNGMKVTIEGSHTVNLGNYESARIGVSLTIPCSPENLEEAYAWGLDWCGKRIQKEVNSAKGIE
jgi:hypothetical protein